MHAQIVGHVQLDDRQLGKQFRLAAERHNKNPRLSTMNHLIEMLDGMSKKLREKLLDEVKIHVDKSWFTN